MTDDGPETADQLQARRQEYVRALRMHGTKQFAPLLGAASSDDLRWIIDILDLQLIETPQQVKDAETLKRIMDDLRSKRSLIVSRLGHVETSEKQASADSRRRYDLATLIFAA